jgi:hypothetical protein
VFELHGSEMPKLSEIEADLFSIFKTGGLRLH